MSNLHVNLDEANKHTPKGFDNVGNNTRPWKDEQSASTYTENFQLPRAINFVDGTLAAPSNGDGDIFVLTGSGTLHADWGTAAAFQDWVRFTNTIATPITPVAGALCYDDTASSWKEFDGSAWAVFGGGGTDTNLGTNNLTNTAVLRTYNINGNELKFNDGINSVLKIMPSGVGFGNVSTPTAMAHIKGAGITSGTTALLVENGAGTDLLEVKNDGGFTLGKAASNFNDTNVTIGENATTTVTGGIAIGLNASSITQIDGIAIGDGASTTGLRSVSLGAFSSANGTSSISIGDAAQSSNSYTIAIGDGASATVATDGIAIGRSTATTGLSSVSLGHLAGAAGVRALSLGANADANGTSSISIGDGAQTSTSYGIAIGDAANASINTDVIAIGRSSNTTSLGAIAIGSSTAGTGTRGLAIGNFMQVTATNAIMIGGSTAAKVNSTASSLEVNFNEATSTIRLAKSADSWINTSANFGIGHAAPTAKLHVVGSTLLDGNLGVFGTTPIAQPTTGIAPSIVTAGVGTPVLHDDTFDGYTLAQIVKIIRNLGLGA